jgi:hypothetical protein
VTSLLASALLVLFAGAIALPFVPTASRIAILFVEVAAIGVAAQMLSRLLRRRRG